MTPLTLAIFAKSPVPGSVKTRLCPPLTFADAARLHAAFFADTVALALQSGLTPTVYFDGPRALLEQTLTAKIEWKPQGDGNLGARLARVPAPCLLVGADCPHLPADILTLAARELDKFDVTLGPAEDGGYYLLGLAAPAPFLFDGIAWSSDKVLEQTLEKITARALTRKLLPTHYDIDTIDNLRRLDKELRAARPELCPATRLVLETLTL